MKRQRKKYHRPLNPWEKDRMDAEDRLLHQYGLRRKEEIWRTETLLRNFRRQARQLLTASGTQAELETKQLLTKLRRLGLVSEGATLDDVLDLTVKNLLERRLQTLVHRKDLAQTPHQARALVIHGHILIGGRRMSVPSYLVPVEEEKEISTALGAPSVPRSPETKAREEKVELPEEVALEQAKAGAGAEPKEEGEA